MNILLLTWKDPYHPHSGWAEKLLHGYAKNLILLGHRVSWVWDGGYDLPEEEIRDGIWIYRTRKSRGTLWLWYNIWKWYRTYRRMHSVDILIDIAGGPPLLSPFYEKNIPILFTLFHIADTEFDAYRYKTGILMRWLYRFSLLLYRKIPTITISASTQNELVQDYAWRSRIDVLDCTLENARTWKRKGDKTRYFIFIGRLTPMKRPDHCIRAFASIPEWERKDSHLHIIGSSNETAYIASLSALAQSLDCADSILFHGHISDEDRDRYIALARATLVTSKKEWYGLVVLESNRLGTPVLAYDVPWVRDAVLPEKNGILVPDWDIDHLSAKMRLLLRDETYYRSLSYSSIEYIHAMSTTYEQTVKLETILSRTLWDHTTLE